MKKTLLLLMLFAGLVRGEVISMTHATNNYLTVTIPKDWTFDVVAGKEEEMQMSLWIPHDGGKTLISLFAYWGSLNPRQYVGTNIVSTYTLGNSDYFLSNQNGLKKLQGITQGQKYAISTTIPLDLKPETLALLLNSLGTLKPK
jgi:hypothetical protein